MKAHLLALSLVASSGLIAEQSDSNHSNSQSTNCSESYCDPCCCSNPRPCIESEAFTAPFYNLECDWGFNFNAEFLYWYARETNLSYASTIPMVQYRFVDPRTFITTGVGKKHSIKTDWDPGFRVGIGFNSTCDGWDYNLTWTWMQNKRTDSVSVPNFGIEIDNGFIYTIIGAEGQSILINPWINNTFFNDFAFDRVKAKYDLRFNQIDLDLGRKYWLSRCFVMRPYIGLRGAWTRVTFETTSSRTTTTTGIGGNVPLSRVFVDSFKTRAWGVGIIGGFEPVWYFSDCFALYGLAGTGALWGDFEVKKSESYAQEVPSDEFGTQNISYSDSGAHEHAQMTGLLDLAIGLRWERTWCCDRYRTALDLGWEHHIFFDQNHRWKVDRYRGGGTGTTAEPVNWNAYTGYDEASGNLGLGGFVLRLNLDF